MVTVPELIVWPAVSSTVFGVPQGTSPASAIFKSADKVVASDFVGASTFSTELLLQAQKRTGTRINSGNTRINVKDRFVIFWLFCS